MTHRTIKDVTGTVTETEPGDGGAAAVLHQGEEVLTEYPIRVKTEQEHGEARHWCCGCHSNSRMVASSRSWLRW